MICTGGTKLTETATLNRMREKTIHKQRVVRRLRSNRLSTTAQLKTRRRWGKTSLLKSGEWTH